MRIGSSVNTKTKYNLSFRQKIDFDEIEKILNKAQEIPQLKGESPDEKVNDAIRIMLETNSAGGGNFKKSINPVLIFLAQKGITFDVKPHHSKYRGDVFIVNTKIASDAKSHLSKTLNDNRSRFLLPVSEYVTYLTPNSARIEIIEGLDWHRSMYIPTLLEDDHMARQYISDYNKFRPKFPTNIVDNMKNLISLKARLKNLVDTISGANDSMYKRALQALMPEEGILPNDKLLKLKPLKDNYKVEYPKPFDWEAYRKALNEPFTL